MNIEEADSNGYTALIIASAFGKTNVGHFLLSKGACVSWTNAFGLPALFFAAKEGHLEMCKELVAKGADANQKSDNSSPWLEACKKGHLNIVEFFANNGQYMEATGSDGDTGLIAASFNGNADVVRFLLSKNARFGRTIDEGFSPLFLAARQGHLDVCKLLVTNGADVNRESENGFSPWLEACGKGHLDIVMKNAYFRRTVALSFRSTCRTAKHFFVLGEVVIIFVKNNVKYLKACSQL
ncbi:hypothetical protein GPALN_012165 [Globodera pallida]|nr:hypothetical protein GPALN_012165 [Globodera pallida]